MQTNPFNYNLVFYAGGKISCESKSANYHMVIVHFDTNMSVIFTGAGVGTAMKTASGATSFDIPTASGIKHATIIFLSHPVIAIDPPYTLDKSVKKPVQYDHPYGIDLGITSQNEAQTDESALWFKIN